MERFRQCKPFIYDNRKHNVLQEMYEGVHIHSDKMQINVPDSCVLAWKRSAVAN